MENGLQKLRSRWPGDHPTFTMSQKKCVMLLLVILLCVILFLTNWNLSNRYADIHTEPSLKEPMDELEKLQRQKKELQNLVAQLKARLDMDNTTDMDQNHLQNHSNFADVTYEEEHARRKTENTASEMWFYIKSVVKKIENGKLNLTADTVSEFKQMMSDYRRTMTADFDKLRKANKAEDWRLQKSLELGDLVQRRFHYIQNPKDCKTAKKIVCETHWWCGFGCSLHHFAFCFIAAYATERTLILKPNGFKYGSMSWESVFEPLSQTCSKIEGGESRTGWRSSNADMKRYDIIDLPHIHGLPLRPDFLPLAVPADLASELSVFHGNPAAWWIGQVLRYLFKLRPEMSVDVINAGKKMGFTNTSTIVGVHIRRTDKIGKEAEYYALEQYMDHVEEYFDQLEGRQAPVKRMVYLATDDPDVLSEARKKYLAYTFISDSSISKSAAQSTRSSENSLRGIIIDIYHLARCDFLVCTFSSNVCRLAYELMQTLHADASNNFRSLDDMFFFWGQNKHNFLALEAHNATLRGFLDLQMGDVVSITNNHWNGTSSGQNLRTKSVGLFHSFKTEDIIAKVQMPSYTQVPRKGS